MGKNKDEEFNWYHGNPNWAGEASDRIKTWYEDTQPFKLGPPLDTDAHIKDAAPLSYTYNLPYRGIADTLSKGAELTTRWLDRNTEEEDRPGWIKASDGNWYRDAGSLHDSFATHRLMPDLAEFEKGYNSHEGMITGVWDKAKEIGGEWWKNISRDPTVNMDSYTTYWLDRLGHKGPPLKEDIVYKGVEKLWEDDYRKYWDERPLDYDWFNR